MASSFLEIYPLLFKQKLYFQFFLKKRWSRIIFPNLEDIYSSLYMYRKHCDSPSW